MADKNYDDDPIGVDEDKPPFFPMADPDAPAQPDWDGVEPEGEQADDAGDDGED